MSSTPYDDDLLALPCERCGSSEGQRCKFPNGANRKCPCICRLRARDRVLDEADRAREARTA